MSDDLDRPEIQLPQTFDELKAAREAGAYDPVFEQHQDDNRWTWDSWRCPRCRSGGRAAFDRSRIAADAQRHMQYHFGEDEERIRKFPVLEYWNSKPNCRAWFDPDGTLRVEHDRPPSRPSLLSRAWRKLRGAPAGSPVPGEQEGD